MDNREATVVHRLNWKSEAAEINMTLAHILERGSTTEWFTGSTAPVWEKHLAPLGPFRSYLELGCWQADSIVWFAEHLLAEDGTAEGVDRWIPHRAWKHVQDEMAYCKELAFGRRDAFNANRKDHKKIVLHESDSADWLAKCPWRYQVIYVDAGHRGDETLMDLVGSWRVLQPGGILICDDTHLYRGKRLGNTTLTGEAWDAFLTCFGHRVEVLYSYKQQAAVIKKSDG